MNCAGLLLAAGRGRRSQQPGSKLLLPHGGGSVLQGTVTAWLQAGLSRVVVVLGFDADRLREALPHDDRLQVVINPDWEEGMASSLRFGLARLTDQPAVLLGLADMPWLGAELVRFLAEQAECPILVPTFRGRRGHPVRFSREHYPELLSLRGDRGAFQLLQKYPVQEVEVATDAILRDLDQPRDLLPRVLLRGGGDLASGVAHRLVRSGFPVAILELPEPRMIRASVCFASALYEGRVEVEGVWAHRAEQPEFGPEISVVVDPEGRFLPLGEVLVEARMLKAPADTRMDQAPLVVGLGPGLKAGRDVHFVVETQRGHQLGRVIAAGEALPDTGVPGELGGESWRRVVRSPRAGVFLAHTRLGSQVQAGDLLGEVAGVALRSELSGTVRGLLRSGLQVQAGEKLADVDPRSGIGIHAISDKARAVAGGVLEAIMGWRFGIAGPA